MTGHRVPMAVARGMAMGHLRVRAVGMAAGTVLVLVPVLALALAVGVAGRPGHGTTLMMIFHFDPTLRLATPGQ